jgi:anti-anti-sigma factor
MLRLMGFLMSTLAAPEPPMIHDSARLAVHWMEDAAVVVTAAGEIDAANADGVGDQVIDAATRGKYLVFNLSEVEFFGTEGFSVLHRISVRCAKAGVTWVLVAGAAVSRVLRICDPEGGLPAVGSVDAAVAMMHGWARPAL